MKIFRNAAIVAALSLSAMLATVSCNAPKTALVVGYNVENMFDTLPNSGAGDNEYLPNTKKNYNSERYNNKLNNISKVLTSINPGQLPDVVGLCEVENRAVMEDLFSRGELRKGGYQVAHFDSPDPRGIDVGMAYSKNFKLLSHRPIPVYTQPDKPYRTRDILYAKGLILGDTLHVFVNHWKSRSGGTEKTEPTRVRSALALRAVTDSILTANPLAKCVILGDFNDTPADSSLRAVLCGPGSHLVNMAAPLAADGRGTHQYRGQWSMLDNIVVSAPLTQEGEGVRCSPTMEIFNAEWICYRTKKGDLCPSRTFAGDKYHNGYSDHFPVYLYLERK